MSSGSGVADGGLTTEIDARTGGGRGRVRPRPSLRGRVALAAVAAVGLVLLLVGISLVGLVERDQRRALDERLVRQAEILDRPRLLSPGGTSRLAGAAAVDLGVVVRVLAPDGDLLLSVGDLAGGALPPTSDPGVTTVAAGGARFRVRTVAAVQAGPLGTVLQVAVPLDPLEEAVASLRRRYIGLAMLALAAAGLAGWAFGGRALRPLSRLRAVAEEVAADADPGRRVAARAGPAEVDELARSFNEMLGRLDVAAADRQVAVDTAREFAANAAHELRTPMTALQANLDVLDRADLASELRAEVLADLRTDVQRLAGVVGALAQLARGDLRPAAVRSPVDLAELVDAAVAAARRRHPQSAISFDVADGVETSVAGWADGLRVLVDNLLDNAARHGRPAPSSPATVAVELLGGTAAVELVITDEGPGIPAAERTAVLERFRRGEGATGPGSGLGLALVDQQVRLHGGRLTIGDRPGGGCRVTVALPRPEISRA